MNKSSNKVRMNVFAQGDELLYPLIKELIWSEINFK